ncbi:MAG: T9SS type A sorting domain-containing protein [Flavobacteriales bacterium]|nr:T9SS type A sorting domain-containing protein [Flavobacteriales bacterium]
MKKHLLITLGLLPALSFAQQSDLVPKVKNEIPQSTSNQVVAFEGTNDVYTPGNFSSSKFYKKHPVYASILIGNTFYDLQTNASVGRRLLLHDDGKVSAVWTTAEIGQAEWPSRGTGYNHKSTNWLSPVSAKFEVNDRTGWPYIGVLEESGTKYEVNMAHVASTGGWILSKNDMIGSTSWTKVDHVLTQLNNKQAIWGRIGTDGKQMIHLVSNYWSSTTAGIPVHYINGVASPSTYSRSKDGGKTWDIMFEALPGYDSTRYVGGGGDNYAIDVKDSIVAIVIGGAGEDVAIWKSTDNGDNFTRIVAEEFPFAPFTKKLIPTAEREKTADGSFDILIDHNNKVHVFFGRTYVADEDITDDSYVFYPATAQLMHWAEGMDTAVLCGFAKDYDQDNTLNINQETYSALDANGNLPAGVTSATRYGSTALVSMPTSSIDAAGNLYVVYSAPHELSLSPFNANYRDLYVSYSQDGGLTWTIGQNITASAYGLIANKENVFASAAKRADTFLHLIYQEDDLPGTNLQNNGTSNAHPNNEQNIMYKAIPLTDILSNSVSDLVSVNKVKVDPKIFFVSQNQPNPASSNTQVFLYMRDGSDVVLTVKDIAGKVILNKELGYLSAGNHAIDIEADQFTSGIYLYSISNDQYSITKKMQVK